MTCPYCLGQPGVSNEAVHLGAGIWTHAREDGGRVMCEDAKEKSREAWLKMAEEHGLQRNPHGA